MVEDEEESRDRELRRKVMIEVALRPLCLGALAVAIVCMVVVILLQGFGAAFLAALAATLIAFVLGVRWTL